MGEIEVENGARGRRWRSRGTEGGSCSLGIFLSFLLSFPFTFSVPLSVADIGGRRSGMPQYLRVVGDGTWSCEGG